MDKKSATPRHPIRIVAERTGLTPATLRAWERRYAVVSPGRSDGAQRLYSDEDIRRLKLIARLSGDGYSLGELSRSTTTALARMTRDVAADAIAGDGESRLRDVRARAAVDRMLTHTRALDTAALRAALIDAVLALSPPTALDAVISPFLDQIGTEWSCQSMSVAQEHLASTTVRDVLGWLLHTTTPVAGAPTFVGCTVSGEQHEFGAMMSGVVAALAGWRVVYLGADLPAGEIARAAKDVKARVVAVSIVNAQSTSAVREQLTALRRGVGTRTTVIAGGASAGDHRLTLLRTSIALAESRAALAAMLDEIWTRA